MGESLACPSQAAESKKPRPACKAIGRDHYKKGTKTMGWIERGVDRTLEKRRETLTDELAELRSDVKGLRRERQQMSEEVTLSDEVVSLRKKISTLDIEKSKAEEEQNRKIRETEHRVGLMKRQQEHDVSNAKRETELQVREGNLSAERERFDKEMEFQRKHLQGEVDRIESVLTKVLERLPNIDVAMRSSLPAGKAAK